MVDTTEQDLLDIKPSLLPTFTNKPPSNKWKWTVADNSKSSEFEIHAHMIKRGITRPTAQDLGALLEAPAGNRGQRVRRKAQRALRRDVAREPPEERLPPHGA